MNFQKYVSVIIPVFNDSKPLKKCLICLENQTYPQDLYEVIVVDNASDEDIENVVNEYSQARITFESNPGSYVARNQGILIAKGEILAFTDADCIPAHNWIEKGVENLLKFPDCGLVAGRVEFVYKKENEPTAIEFYDSVMFLNQKRFVKEHFGATANIFTWGKVCEKVGGFDPHLKSNGDREWGNRVFSAGYEVVYAEDALVKHPARDSFTQLAKKVRRLAGGHYDVQKERSFFSRFQYTIQKLKPPLKWLIWRLSDPNLKNYQIKINLIIITILLNYIMFGEIIRLQFGGISQRK